MDYLEPIACDSLAIQLITASTSAWDVLQQSKLTKSYRTPLAAHFGLTTQNHSNLQLAHPLFPARRLSAKHESKSTRASSKANSELKKINRSYRRCHYVPLVPSNAKNQ